LHGVCEAQVDEADRAAKAPGDFSCATAGRAEFADLSCPVGCAGLVLCSCQFRVGVVGGRSVGPATVDAPGPAGD
jgi:hypothetical protein